MNAYLESIKLPPIKLPPINFSEDDDDSQTDKTNDSQFPPLTPLNSIHFTPTPVQKQTQSKPLTETSSSNPSLRLSTLTGENTIQNPTNSPPSSPYAYTSSSQQSSPTQSDTSYESETPVNSDEEDTQPSNTKSTGAITKTPKKNLTSRPPASLDLFASQDSTLSSETIALSSSHENSRSNRPITRNQDRHKQTNNR